MKLRVSLKRIQKFLLLDEVDPDQISHETEKGFKKFLPKIIKKFFKYWSICLETAIELQNASFSWDTVTEEAIQNEKKFSIFRHFILIYLW